MRVHDSRPTLLTSLPSRFWRFGRKQRLSSRWVPALLLVSFTFVVSAGAQVNGIGQNPYLGWTSWDQQTMQKGFLTQANIQAQSDALYASGLEAHGFRYVNIDSGWQGSFDSNGRPIPNTTRFPDIKALVDHIHANGQLAGIYWIPGVEYPAVVANSSILGTPYHIDDILQIPYTRGNAFGATGPNPYHYKIDFTKPGAQEYINSVVDLFASWGIDFIKLDGVTPGSYVDSLAIDNRPDVAAWSKAIAQSGRNISGLRSPGRSTRTISPPGSSTRTHGASTQMCSVRPTAPPLPTGP